MLGLGAIGYESTLGVFEPSQKWLQYAILGSSIAGLLLGALNLMNSYSVLPKDYLLKLLGRSVKLYCRVDDEVKWFVGKIVDAGTDVVIMLDVAADERYHLPVSYVRFVVETKEGV